MTDALPISDEDLQWVEELLPTADGNVLAPMLMMQRMAARIRQLEAEVVGLRKLRDGVLPWYGPDQE